MTVEHYAALSPMASYEYACVKRARFAQGEAAMGSLATTAYLYAEYVLHGPFPQGEGVLYQDAIFGPLYLKLLDRAFEGLKEGPKTWGSWVQRGVDSLAFHPAVHLSFAWRFQPLTVSARMNSYGVHTPIDRVYDLLHALSLAKAPYSDIASFFELFVQRPVDAIECTYPTPLFSWAPPL